MPGRTTTITLATGETITLSDWIEDRQFETISFAVPAMNQIIPEETHAARELARILAAIEAAGLHLIADGPYWRIGRVRIERFPILRKWGAVRDLERYRVYDTDLTKFVAWIRLYHQAP